MPSGEPKEAAWRCLTCGESIEEQFDTCWKCAAPAESADEAPLPDKMETPASTPETIARTQTGLRCRQCDAPHPSHRSWCPNAESMQPGTGAFAVVKRALGAILVLGGVLTFGLAALLLLAVFVFSGATVWEAVLLLMIAGAVAAIIIRVGVELCVGDK